MILDGSDTISGHVPVDSAEKLEETGPAKDDEHLPQTAWTRAPPAPKGEGTSHQSIRLHQMWRDFEESLLQHRIGARAAFDESGHSEV